MQALNPAYEDWISLDEEERKNWERPKRHIDFHLHGIWGAGVPGKLPVMKEDLTKGGAAPVSMTVLM